MPLIDPLLEAESRILILKPELRPRFIEALRNSLELDTEHESPRPYSPSDIHDEYGIDLETQLKHYIALSRTNAVHFLRTVGKGISKHAFNKRYSSEEYLSTFGREVCSWGNQHVFTYAEVLHLCGYEIPVSLPAPLQRLL